MDTLPIKTKKPRRSNNSLPMLFLPEELLAEILPFFNVKTIMRLKCLSKSWMTFISDSNFVQKHLKNSSRNPHLTMYWHQRNRYLNSVPYPVYRILKNPSNINLYDRKNFQHSKHLLEQAWQLVGSCNGLLCFLFYSETLAQTIELCFWNPATRTTSKKLGSLYYGNWPNLDLFYFTFGYDASMRTYKVVAFRARENGDSWISEVKVFSVGDNCWRNIQSFPVIPFNWFDIPYGGLLNDGVHFNGTVNWLALHKSITHVEQTVIISLDLSTDRYKQFLLPPGFDEVPFFHPVLRVLMDSLCFSYNSNKTEFVLWKMKEVGVQESWSQLFKINDQNLHQVRNGVPLVCLYVNGDTAIFADKFHRAFTYNLKDKTVKYITKINCIHWFDKVKDYVESLVSVC